RPAVVVEVEHLEGRAAALLAAERDPLHLAQRARDALDEHVAEVALVLEAFATVLLVGEQGDLAGKGEAREREIRRRPIGARLRRTTRARRARRRPASPCLRSIASRLK